MRINDFTTKNETNENVGMWVMKNHSPVSFEDFHGSHVLWKTSQVFKP